LLQIFLQITLALPPFIAATKRLLERGEIAAPFNSMAYVAYESNIDFEIRYATQIRDYGTLFNIIIL